MTTGIYGLFETKDNECLYVGLSSNIEKRYKQHLKLLRGKRHPREDFVEWWISNKENNDFLELRILEKCSKERLNEKEIYWFSKLKPKFYGKEPNENEKWEHSSETKRKISVKLSDPSSKIEVQCEYCKNSFFAYIKKRRKFCSKECGDKNRSVVGNGKHKELYQANLEELYYKKEMSLSDIAKMFNTSFQTVHYVMKRKGIECRSIRTQTSRSIQKMKETRLKNLNAPMV